MRGCIADVGYTTTSCTLRALPAARMVASWRITPLCGSSALVSTRSGTLQHRDGMDYGKNGKKQAGGGLNDEPYRPRRQRRHRAGVALNCACCDSNGGEVLWHSTLCRVVLVPEPGYPGFLRVILNAHVKEMTDLATSDRAALMQVVFAAEGALREVMRPEKINLASLGNMAPHIHWHVIPRFADDPHFPSPVWGKKRRETSRTNSEELRTKLAFALNRRLAPAQETG